MLHSHIYPIVSRTWRVKLENQRPWNSLSGCPRNFQILNSKFRAHHHALIDVITDDDESLAKEQDVLDSHDDLVAKLSVRVKQVIAASSPSSVEFSHKIASRKLTHLQKSL